MAGPTVDVIFQGKICQEQNLKEVLEDVLSLKEGEIGILRITGADGTVDGSLVIHQNRRVIDAYLADKSERGYPALRRLMGVSEGKFAYGDVGTSAPSDGDRTVRLELKTLAGLLPDISAPLPGELEAAEPENRLDLSEAAALVREKTQVAPPAPGPETIPQLRELQSKRRLSRRLLLLLLALIMLALGAYFYQSKMAKIGSELDKGAFEMIGGLKEKIQGPAEDGGASRPAAGHNAAAKKQRKRAAD